MKNRFLTIVVMASLFSYFASDACSEAKKELVLSFEDISRISLKNNFDIQLAKYDAYIKENDLLIAESIFDTIIFGKITYRDDQSKPASTIVGTKSQSNEYELNLEKKLPTGTTVKTGLSHERNWSNSSFTTTNPAHESKATVGLTQELGKNFFGLIDRGNIKITKLDIKNSSYTSLDRIESYLADIQKAYWGLILKQEELDIEKEMLKKAEDLLKTHTEKKDLGLVEQPEVLASGANLKQRENEVILGQNTLNIAQNDLVYKLNFDPDIVTIKAKDELGIETAAPDYIKSLKTAIQLRRDYFKQKNELEAKNIKVAIKKNSLWPEINLELTFSRNGLDSEYKEAFGNITNEDNPEFYAGISFSYALENKKAKGEFNKAKLEKAREILKLKSVERKIVIDIKDSVDTLTALINAEKNAEEVASLQEEKLKAEERRFRTGRSDTDTLIRYQEDLLNAYLAQAKARYNVRLAEIDLELSKNALLARYWDETL